MTAAGKRTCIRMREKNKNEEEKEEGNNRNEGEKEEGNNRNEEEKEEGNNRNVVVMVVVVIHSSTIRDAVLK